MAHKLKTKKIHTATKNKQIKRRRYYEDINNETISAIEFKDISEVSSSYGNLNQEFLMDDEPDFMINAENSQGEDGIYAYSNNLLIEHKKDSGNSAMETNYSNKVYRRKVYPIENRCYVCPKDFSQQKDLVRHAQQLHPNDKAYKCRHCPTLFSKLKSLSTHFKRCHANLAKTISCDYCYKSFFAQFQLERHRRTHTEYNNYLEYGHTEGIAPGNSNTNILGADDVIYENRKGKIYPIQKKCAICNMKFSLQKTLVKHCQQAHPNDKAFRCLYCPTIFSKLKSVTTHYKRSHSKSTKTIFCEYCNMSFFTKFLLERHLRSHTEKRPFHCHLCDKSYKYKRNLDVHMRTHSKAKTSSNNGINEKFVDDYCENDEEEEIALTDQEHSEDEEENEYYDFDNHTQFAEDEYYENDDEETLATGDEYYCENDKEQEGNNFNKSLQYQHKNTLKNHQKDNDPPHRQKNNDPPAEIITINDDDDDCDATGKEHDNSNNLYKNTYFIIDEFNTDTEQDDQLTATAADIPNDDEDYDATVSVVTEQNECRVCRKVFKCQQSVARHLHRHHPEIEFYKCPYCDDNFYSLDSLAEHIKLKKHPQKQNVCKYCLKSFDRRTDLNRHVRIHTDERPYSCNECDTAFKQINHLKRHNESMHSSLYQRQKFNCEFCPKFFSDADMLKRHSGTHDRFPCTMCSKIFKKRYDWQRHEQTHSSRMDLICDYCLKSFNSNEALNRHINTHTGELKFLCTVCKKTFRRKSHLINHHKSHKKC